LIKKLKEFYRKKPQTIGEPSTPDDKMLGDKTLQLTLDETHRSLLLHYGGVARGDIRISGLQYTERRGDDTCVDLTPAGR
ncbi:1,3-beta-glucan synthase regulator, partial [Capnocytophaga gingivalis]|nr:1,3-beta-glucan synthase regulator [Capnocytophaga gingivalis]